VTDFYIDSETGRIGQFWWFNSNNVERLWMGNVSPWVNKWCIRWGTCGFGRNIRVYMEPIDD
jgi:hypothetical protein